jgi:transcriptional regulator GlxA family with amidase domain
MHILPASGARGYARRFPAVKLDANPIFTCDGKIWTSAGVTAGIDLTLALVAIDVGADVALSVARELVVFLKRPDGQSQFSTHLIAQKTPIKTAQEFISDHRLSDLSIPALAGHVGVSVRSFARAFRQEVQMTPTEYVEAGRLEMARRLAEDAKIPMEKVASQSGFIGTIALRRAFVRKFWVSPFDYRKSFAQ